MRVRSRRAVARPLGAIGLGVGLLVAGGVAHRLAVGRIELAEGRVVHPRQPLATLPYSLGCWHGVDEPLDEEILRIAHVDYAYVNRRYTIGDGEAAYVYVGLGHPRTQLIHRAEICFAAAGWDLVEREDCSLAVQGRGPSPAELLWFQKQGGEQGSVLALASYIINGRYGSDPKSYRFRMPNLFSSETGFVLRVEISMRRSRDREADVRSLLDLGSHVQAAILPLVPYLEEPG